MLVALTSLTLNAQMAGIVRGTVRDSAGTPVDGAVVTFVFEGGVTRRFEVKTDKAGVYSQIGLSPGPYTITAVRDGVGRKSAEVTLRPGARVTVNLDLEPSAAAAPAPAGSPALQEGLAAARTGRHLDAIAKLDEAVKADAKCFDCHYNLGLVYTTTKDYAKAAASLEAARALRPEAPEPMEALAAVFNATRRFDEAAKATDAALALRTAGGGAAAVNAPGVFDQGLVLWNAGKIDEALARFRETLRLDPAHGESHYWLGMGHLNQGRMPEAAQELEIYLAREPGGRFAAQARSLLPQIKKPLV